MLTEVSYDELRKMLVQERQSSSIQTLTETFFQDYEAILSRKQEGLKKEFTIDEAKSIENFKRLLQDLRKQRLYKLLFKALKDCEQGTVSSEGLVTEEKELYNDLIRLINSYLRISIEKKPVKEANRSLKATIVSPVTEFIGFDGKTYGPFSVGESIELPEEIASFLSKRKVIEIT